MKPDGAGVTERLQREELARGARAPGAPPARPRPAATVVLARPTREAREGGFQVLLLRRPERSRFAAGAYVFPGGTVDPGDAAPGLLQRLPAEARGQGPALAAALRELFEETGFLLSDRPVREAERRAARAALLEGSRGFLELVRELGVGFRELRAVYLSRWITPEPLAHRYDARFFLAPAPAGEPELTGELEGHVWLAPGAAVEAFGEGRLPMLFPTRVTLETLARHPTLQAVREAWRGRRVEAVRPRLLVRGGSVRAVLPGDPEWDEAR